MQSTRFPHSYAYSSEQESLLSHSHPPPLPLHPAPASLFLSRHFGGRRNRRSLSLEFPELLRAGGQPPHIQNPDSDKKTGSGAWGSLRGGSGTGSGLGVDHRDCNGKAPSTHNHLMTNVFPQVNARQDRADLDEETDYVSFGVFFLLYVEKNSIIGCIISV